MSFEKFWFKPEYQPTPEKPVEFELKPLDMETYFNLQVSISRSGLPSWEDQRDIFRRCVTNWRGIDLQWNGDNGKKQILEGEANPDWQLWLFQIAVELGVRPGRKKEYAAA